MSVNEKMTAIADAIREKTGDAAKLSLDGMAQTIRKLPAPIVNTAAGNPITLSDATDLKLQGLNIYGKTTQKTTTGKNLLPNNATTQTIFGVKFTVDSDGTITVNGTAENYADLYVYGQQNDNGNYLFIPKGSKFVGAEDVAANPFWIYREKTAGNLYNVHNINPLLEERDCYFYGICLRVSIDKTVSNFRTKPMFCIATSDDTYEPYTGGIPSPNPDYPQELVSAGDGGSIGVTVAGKNLLNYSAWKNVAISKGSAIWENNGVTLTATANDCYTEYEEKMNFLPEARVPMTEGETITLSWEETTNVRGSIMIFPNGTVDGLKTTNNANAKKLSYTAGAGVTFISFRFGVAEAGTTISYKNIQIEIGSAATAYEPYKGQTLHPSTPNGLPGIPVTSGGNYTDETGQQWVCDEVDFGRGVYVQRIGKIALNGTETVAAPTDLGNTVRFMCSLQLAATAYVWGNTDGFFSHGQYYQAYSEDNVQRAYASSETVVIAMNKELIGTTAEEIRVYNKAQYDAGTPLTVLYPLATPIETALSAEELAAYAALHTNYPNTTILNDSGAGMEVSYVADTKLYIDNKINAMTAAIVNA